MKRRRLDEKLSAGLDLMGPRGSTSVQFRTRSHSARRSLVTRRSYAYLSNAAKNSSRAMPGRCVIRNPPFANRLAQFSPSAATVAHAESARPSTSRLEGVCWRRVSGFGQKMMRSYRGPGTEGRNRTRECARLCSGRGAWFLLGDAAAQPYDRFRRLLWVSPWRRSNEAAQRPLEAAAHRDELGDSGEVSKHPRPAND